MVKQTSLRCTCSQVGGVGQWGQFVSCTRSRQDHAGNQRRVQSHGLTDRHECDAQSSGYCPGRSKCDTYDRTKYACQGQKEARIDALQSIEYHGRDASAPLERTDQAPYTKDDDDSLQRLIDCGQTACQHFLVGVTTDPSDDHCHDTRNQHRDVWILAPVQHVVGDHDHQKNYDREQGKDRMRKTRCLVFHCCKPPKPFIKQILIIESNYERFKF